MKTALLISISIIFFVKLFILASSIPLIFIGLPAWSIIIPGATILSILYAINLEGKLFDFNKLKFFSVINSLGLAFDFVIYSAHFDSASWAASKFIDIPYSYIYENKIVDFFVYVIDVFFAFPLSCVLVLMLFFGVGDPRKADTRSRSEKS